AFLGGLGTGEQADNSDNPFGVYVDPSVSYGEILPFELVLWYDGGSSTAHFSIPTKLFQNVIYQTGLPASGVSSITLCMEDTNHDSYPEVLLTRIFQSAQYYRNLANGGFANQPLPMDILATIGLRILDLDNDGKKDLLVPGNVPSEGFSKVVFRQIADHQFEAVAPPGDIQDSAGSVQLGLDYNNDGLVDLMVLGGYLVRLFRNEGNLQFSEVTEDALPEIAYNGA
ncbi:unnamed protein product, partial [marine sediment metagenome]